MACISRLAEAGHTVLCSLPRIPLGLLQLAGRVVLLSSGYSIYAGPRDQIQEYITSSALDFVLQSNVSYDPAVLYCIVTPCSQCAN